MQTSAETNLSVYSKTSRVELLPAKSRVKFGYWFCVGTQRPTTSNPIPQIDIFLDRRCKRRITTLARYGCVTNLRTCVLWYLVTDRTIFFWCDLDCEPAVSCSCDGFARHGAKPPRLAVLRSPDVSHDHHRPRQAKQGHIRDFTLTTLRIRIELRAERCLLARTGI